MYYNSTLLRTHKFFPDVKYHAVKTTIYTPDELVVTNVLGGKHQSYFMWFSKYENLMF